ASALCCAPCAMWCSPGRTRACCTPATARPSASATAGRRSRRSSPATTATSSATRPGDERRPLRRAVRRRPPQWQFPARKCTSMPDYHFPADLAEQVTRIWDSFLDGVVFSRPPLPSPAKLRTLMEVAYLAGLEKEEGRPLCFMICCTMRSEVIHRHGHERIVEMWPFSACRPYNVQELRRLAVTCDIDTAAI